LAWRLPRESGLAHLDPPVDWQALYATVASLAMSAPDRVGALLKGGELTPAERAILSNLVTTALRTALAKTFSSEADRDSRFRYLLAGLRYLSTSALVKATEADAVQSIDPEYISKSSGIPYAALQAMAGALARKLNIETSSSLLPGAVGDLARRAVGSLARRVGLGS
jgi:hypothetical protein